MSSGVASKPLRLRLFGLAVLCLKVALVPLVFDTGADLTFGVAQGLASHALSYVLAGILVALAIENWRRLFVPSWLHLPVLAFLGASVVATLFAADPLLALFGTHDQMLGLDTIADNVVLYFAVVFLVRTRVDAVAVVISGLGTAVAVLGYEFLQLIGRDPIKWSLDPSARPFSTLGQTNSLAEYLTVAAAAAAAFAFFDAGLRATGRILSFVLAVVALGGVAVTVTRSAVIGIVAAAVLLGILTWSAHPNRLARTLTVAGGAVATAALALLLFFTPLGARILNTVELSTIADGDQGPRLEQSAEVRVALYQVAVNMVLERPIQGYGPDNFLVGLSRYRTDDEPDEVKQSPATSAHGWVAQTAATTGILGLSLFVAIAAMAVWLTFRGGFRPAAWAAAAMLAAFLGAGLTTPNAVGTEWLFWVSAAGVAAATARPSIAPRATDRRPGRSRPQLAILALGSAALGCVLALLSVTALDASRSARDSQLARQGGRVQDAINLGIRATRSDPRRPEYWDALGLAYVGGDRLKEAASAFDQAMQLAPYNVRYHGNLARAYVVLFQRGDLAAGTRARDVAERAVRADPNNPLANLTRAIVMQVTGDLPAALTSAERALALDPVSNNADLYLTTTQVLIGTGRDADAVAMARRAIGTLANAQRTVPIRVELARALAMSGRAAEALVEIDAALSIRPNDPAALQLRSQIRASMTTQ
jgi:O-antigen ligase/tetratricopeptide (TPR) repeat protein